MKKVLIITLVGLLVFKTLGQMTVQLDTTFCLSEPLNLNYLNIYNGTLWSSMNSDDVSFTTPYLNSTEVVFNRPGDYRLVVSGLGFKGNVVHDGGFDLFDLSQNYELDPELSFQTTYSRATGNNGGYITNTGQFRVDTEIVAWSQNGNEICDALETREDTVTDETVSVGNFLYFDTESSSTLPPTAPLSDKINEHYVWRQSGLEVQPNTTYLFHMRVANWGGGGPQGTELSVKINDKIILLSSGNEPQDSTFKVLSDCEWHAVSGSWFSGGNTMADLFIGSVDLRDIAFEGALDDIALFETYEVLTDTFNIEVLDCSLSSVTGGFSLCDGDEATVEFESDEAFFLGWYNDQETLVSDDNPYSFFPIDTTVLVSKSKNVSHKNVTDSGFEKNNDLEFVSDYALASFWSALQGTYVIYHGESISRVAGDIPDHTNDSIGGGILTVSLENDRSLFSHEAFLGLNDIMKVRFSVRNMNVSFSPASEPSELVLTVNDSIFWFTSISQSSESWEEVSVLIRPWEESDYDIRLFSISSAWDGVVGFDDLQIEDYKYEKSDSVIVSPYNCTVLSSELDSEIPGCVWPNPATDYIYIQSNGMLRVEVYNYQGAFVNSTNQEFLDVSAYKPGVYLVQVYSEEGVKKEKIIIQ